MSTIQTDVHDNGSLDDGALSQDVDGAAEALMKRWEDQDKKRKKASPASEDAEDATDETSDETDEDPADTSEDTGEDEEGSEEDPDADAEETEETDDAEDEDEEKKSSKVASDDAEVVVTVDGEERRVSVKDLKRLYGQEAALTRKSQAVATKQKEYEDSTKKAVHAISTLAERAMAAWKPYSEIDWAVAQTSLSKEDFAALRTQAKQKFDDAKFLTEELDKTMTEAQGKFMSSLKEKAKETVEVLKNPESPHHIPGWSNDVYNSIREFAIETGMSAEVVNTLVDPAAIKIIHMAMSFKKAKDVATKKVVKAIPKKVLTSKTGSAASSPKDAKKAKAMAQFKKTGSVDDAAAALMARWS
jgi:hypothetical protein